MWTAWWITYVNFIQTAVCVSELQIFSWGKVSLAVCPIIRLSSFHLATEVITDRLEWKFCACVFRHHLMVGLCDSHFHFLKQFGSSWLFLLYFLGTISIDAVGIISIRWKTFRRIHHDTKNWSPVTKCVVEYSLTVAHGGSEYSIGFIEAKPRIVKLLLF